MVGRQCIVGQSSDFEVDLGADLEPVKYKPQHFYVHCTINRLAEKIINMHMQVSRVKLYTMTVQTYAVHCCMKD